MEFGRSAARSRQLSDRAHRWATHLSDGARRLSAPGPQRCAGDYVLLARGPDGQARCESFGDRNAYRTRLASLESGDGPISLDDVVDLLSDL